VDFRDLWRVGSGLTLRRLKVLLRALPPDSWFWSEYRAALERDEARAKVERIRERTEHYARQQQSAVEEGS
jgi:hypothetical protein